MFLLLNDIFLQRADMRRADGKNAVSALPMKVVGGVTPLLEPA